MKYQQDKTDSQRCLPGLSSLMSWVSYIAYMMKSPLGHRFRFSSFCRIVFYFCALLFATHRIASAQQPTSLESSPSNSSAAPTAVDPNHLILQTIQQLVWGPSYSCNVRQVSFFNDMQLVAEGEYYQAGEGTGQLKSVIAMTAGEKSSQFVQISDGRLLWTAIGEKEPPRRVYLDRVRQSHGSMARNPAGHPEAALYLAIGGHAEMMRSLYGRYRWFKVFTGVDAKGVQVWQLIGTIRKEPPPLMTRTKIDALFCSENPPPEVPTDVRLTLGRDGKLNLFPLKIEYYKSTKTKGSPTAKFVPLSTIQIENVVSPIEITKDMFQYKVRDDADQIDEETNEYLPLNPIAESPGNPRR